ncbi:MAG: ATP-binding protein [Cyanobacteria bacterium P01_H01_bin.15]
MIAISMPYRNRTWSVLSFNSTLYLYPVLELLLSHVPERWHGELRLGLQEALVNAVKHGNQLDPDKAIVIHFSESNGEYTWIISDEGEGFSRDSCACNHAEQMPPSEAENGRGLCLLHAIFDRVHWNAKGTQVELSKQAPRWSFLASEPQIR